MRNLTWTSEERALKDLVLNSHNPRQISKPMAEHLQTSLSKFGVCQPIVINTDNYVIGGHQRIRTLKSLGESHVLVMVPSRTLEVEEVEELSIRLNKNTGSFDFDLLANMWDPDTLIDCGFTADELHLDIEEEEEKVAQGATITISVTDDQHAKMIEQHLSTMLCDYPGATCRVKKKK